MTRFESDAISPVPPEWTARETLTLIAPDGRANVTASSEPVSPDTTPEEFAVAIGASLAGGECPGYSEVSFGPTSTIGGEPAWLRTFNWDPPDADPVTQVQPYFTRRGRGYTLTATSAVDDHQRYEQMLTEPAARRRLARGTGDRPDGCNLDRLRPGCTDAAQPGRCISSARVVERLR